MAILTLAGSLTDIAGSAGNATYVRTPYGVSVRDRPTPQDARTALQLQQRWRVERASAAWRGLDPEATARRGSRRRSRS